MIFPSRAASFPSGAAPTKARAKSAKAQSAVGASIPYVAGLLLLACTHHWLLCLLQSVGIRSSQGLIAMMELLIYVGCLPLLRQRISARIITAILFMIGAITLMAILRDGYLDIKAMRDLLIPAVFIWAGRSWRGTTDDLDRILSTLIVVIIGIGLLEATFFDTYTRFINTFQYYFGLGGFTEAQAQVSGQTVTLNGLRPDGIGRTLLPQVFGSHRISSVFLEPVSFGNFAVIVLAWGLAKPVEQWRKALWFGSAALIMIVLADSRFAIYSVILLFALRACVHRSAHAVAILMPLVGIALLLIVALYTPSIGDNLWGRLTNSGMRLLKFNEWALLGLNSHNSDFGDMGYAYAISRFGLPLAALLWLLLFSLPLQTEQARRYRTFIAAYISLILCVSGTSVFALKTAALLWFLFGALSVQTETKKSNPIKSNSLQPAASTDRSEPIKPQHWSSR